MAGTPRKNLPDGFAESLPCSICGQTTLSLVHHASLPDFVSCKNCGSAFVVEEGGERVMYGKIPDAYPGAQRFALRQWAWPEAIARRAVPERSPTAPLPEPVLPARAALPSAPTPLGFADPRSAAYEDSAEEDAAIRARLLSVEEDHDYITPVPYMPGSQPSPPKATPAPPSHQAPPTFQASADQPEVPAAERPNEPPKGVRYRVVLSGERVEIPRTVCAHCLRTPVRGTITTFGQLPSVTPTSRRRPVRLDVPLCGDCQRRAATRSPEENTARFQALLLSFVAALGTVVLGLALGLVDLQNDGPVGVFVLFTLAILGFTVPAILLFGRSGRMPLPEDAVYVRTTLFVPPDVEGLSTAFEWRNSAFAELFQGANPANVVGKVVEVRRTA